MSRTVRKRHTYCPQDYPLAGEAVVPPAAPPISEVITPDEQAVVLARLQQRHLAVEVDIDDL